MVQAIQIKRFTVQPGPREKSQLHEMENFINEIGEESIINNGIVASLGEGAPQQRPTIYTIFYKG